MSKEIKRELELNMPCAHCGRVFKVMVAVEDWIEWMSPNRKRNIQDIFHYLTPDERELFISHTCEECWNKMFQFNEDEEDEILTDEEFEAKYGLDCEEFYEANGNVSVEEIQEVF